MKASPRPPRSNTAKVRSEDGSFTLSELRRRDQAFHAQQRARRTCLFCPDWQFEGTMEEGFAAWVAHMRADHRKQKTGRGTAGKDTA